MKESSKLSLEIMEMKKTINEAFAKEKRLGLTEDERANLENLCCRCYFAEIDHQEAVYSEMQAA